MRFADELVADRELDVATPDKEPTEIEVDTAQLLVDQLDSSFEPESYANTYRDAVLQLIERKARGEAIEAPDTQPTTAGGDLLSALQASLSAHGHARRRSRNAGSPSSGGAGRKRGHTRGAR
jgi:DNA end-binding protein Ku